MNPQPAPVRLSVSLVVYRSDLVRLRQTLGSLLASVIAARKRGLLDSAELVVLDNSEQEAYALSVEALLSEVLGESSALAFRCLRAERNLGYGAGHNNALQGMHSDLHLVLNPDVELSGHALIVGIEDLAAHPQTVLLAPEVLSGSGAPEYLCRDHPSVLVLTLRAFAPAFIRARFAGRLAEYELRDLCGKGQRARIPLASGCFMLVRTPALRNIGGFDPRYFLYFEDYDLCRRLMPEGELIFQPGMRIVHHGGYAARKGIRHLAMFVRSGLRFFGQYGWRWI